MPRSPSDKLFRLIQSLTPTELKYFRQYIKGKTTRDSKYQQMFDLMVEMSSFDERTLKTRIYKDDVFHSKKYIELKAYLYDLIVEALTAFDATNSVSARVGQLLQGVAALYKRGHYTECRELLQKASKLAQKHEMFARQLDIARWDKHLAYTQMDIDYLHRHLDELQHNEERALASLSNLTTYRQAFFQVYATIKKEAQQRGGTPSDYLQSLVNQDVFKNDDRVLSHSARITYYRTLNLYHYAVLETEAFYETGRQLVALIESQPNLLPEYLSDYIAALSNLILSCGMMARYDEVRECLEKMRRITPVTQDDRQKIHRQYYSNYFALCTSTGEFEEAKKAIRKCQEEAEALQSTEYETVSFLYQYSLICFGCEDYDKALFYLNQWMSMPRSVEREDLQIIARMLLLILHYELGNTLLMESLIRSATRFVKKKSRFYALEERFVSQMDLLIKKRSKRDRLGVFKQLHSTLQEPEFKSTARALLQTFALDAWIEAKINGDKFAAVIRRKAGHNDSE